MTKLFAKSLSIAMLACGAMMGLSTTAQSAVVYQGSWDPAYGPDFPTMGWRAFSNLVLSDACATATSGFTGRLNGDPLNPGSTAAQYAACLVTGAGTGVRLTAVQMQFYGLPSGVSTDFYTGVDYTFLSGGECLGSSCLQYVDFVNGEVVGLQTSFSDTLTPGITTNNYLSSNIPDPFCSGSPVSGLASSAFDWNMNLGVGSGSDSSVAGNRFGECTNTRSAFQPDVVTLVRLNPVPEPVSLSLVLAALALGGLATRSARRGR